MFSGNVRPTAVQVLIEDWYVMKIGFDSEWRSGDRVRWMVLPLRGLCHLFIFVNPCFSWAKGRLLVGFAYKIRRNIRMFNRKEFSLLWRNP
jgi:hypothetical protein